MKRLTIILAALVFSFAANAHEPAYEYRTFTSGEGTSIKYRLLRPDQEAKGKKFPLVIFLHGAGQKGNDNERQMSTGSEMFLNPVNREKYPAFVMFPQCPKGEWWTYDRKPKDFDRLTYSDDLNPSLAMVKSIIDELLGMPEVDATRVYIIGFSMGGVGTYDLVAHYPHMFAAAVPLCGAIAPGHLAEAKNTAFRIYHGDADTSVPVKCSRRAYLELKDAGIDVEYIELPGAKHGICTQVFNMPDFMEWIFKQKNRKAKAHSSR